MAALDNEHINISAKMRKNHLCQRAGQMMLKILLWVKLKQHKPQYTLPGFLVLSATWEKTRLLLDSGEEGTQQA